MRDSKYVTCATADQIPGGVCLAIFHSVITLLASSVLSMCHGEQDQFKQWRNFSLLIFALSSSLTLDYVDLSPPVRLNLTSSIRFTVFGMMSLGSLMGKAKQGTVTDYLSEPRTSLSLPTQFNDIKRQENKVL
jgi:hypothetical protein